MTTQTNCVRQATEDDIPAMAQIIFDWETATEWVPDTYTLQETDQFLREIFPKRTIWVAGEPVQGYLSLNPEEDRIGMLYCQSRGAGYGKKLMEQAKAGRTNLWLTTQACNEAAQRFYRREGFVVAGEFPVEPPNTLPEIRMEWQA